MLTIPKPNLQFLSNQSMQTLVVSASFFISLYTVEVAADEAAYRWSQEVGYYTVDPNVSSSEISGPGLPPATAVDVDDGGTYVFTTTYHHSDNLSIEFFYSGWYELDAVADGSIAGLGEIGTFEYLAPTLMINWTFGDDAWLVRPHIGVGINRMLYGHEHSNVALDTALGGPTEVSLENTWGAAFTAGITTNFSKRIYLTASYVQIESDTNAVITTDAVGTRRAVDLDTDLKIAYLNIGYRF